MKKIEKVGVKKILGEILDVILLGSINMISITIAVNLLQCTTNDSFINNFIKLIIVTLLDGLINYCIYKRFK